MVNNSGHCIYSIGLRCFGNCLLLFHFSVLLIYIYTVEVRLSGTRLTGKFDQPDLIGEIFL